MGIENLLNERIQEGRNRNLQEGRLEVMHVEWPGWLSGEPHALPLEITTRGPGGPSGLALFSIIRTLSGNKDEIIRYLMPLDGGEPFRFVNLRVMEYNKYDINDETGEVEYEVDVKVDSNSDITPEDGSSALASQLDAVLARLSVLEAISNEIQDQSVGTSVAQELSTAGVTASSLGETIMTRPSEVTEVVTTGTLDTNIDTSNLNNNQKKEAMDVVGESIATTLQNEGIMNRQDTVTVTDINDVTGEVEYKLDVKVDPSRDISFVEDASSALASQLDAVLARLSVLEAISNEIQDQSVGTSVAQELSTAGVTASSLGETIMTRPSEVTEVVTTGTLDTNIDTSNLK